MVPVKMREDHEFDFLRLHSGLCELRLDFLVERGALLDVQVHHAREGALEPREVRAALVRVDVVGEGEDGLLVGAVPLHRDLDGALGGLALEEDDLLADRLLVLVEVADEVLDAALVLELDAVAARALVGQRDAQDAREEGRLAQALLEDREVEVEALEDLGVGEEADGGACVVGLADLGKWIDRPSFGIPYTYTVTGYILGSIGDPFTAVLTDMWAPQAPIYTVDGTTFTSDFSDSHTTRMIALLDHMFANKTLAIDGLFTPDWVKKWKGKVLAIPGPTWFTGALFLNKDNIAGQPGEWGAGHALHWAGEPIATGNVGGGFWYGSSHSANLACVGTYLQYVTSGPQSVKLITGLPAYASTGERRSPAATPLRCRAATRCRPTRRRRCRRR